MVCNVCNGICSGNHYNLSDGFYCLFSGDMCLFIRTLASTRYGFIFYYHYFKLRFKTHIHTSDKYMLKVFGENKLINKKRSSIRVPHPNTERYQNGTKTESRCSYLRLKFVKARGSRISS